MDGGGSLKLLSANRICRFPRISELVRFRFNLRVILRFCARRCGRTGSFRQISLCRKEEEEKEEEEEEEDKKRTKKRDIAAAKVSRRITRDRYRYRVILISLSPLSVPSG